MPQYLIAMYQPDGGPPAEVDLGAVMAGLGALNADIKAAGSWVFAGGLHDSTTATVLRAQGGDVVVTDGPYLEGKEHLGGFTVVEADDLDVVLGWARRSAQITRLPTEVRPFRFVRDDG